jgi:hypothetical protein
MMQRMSERDRLLQAYAEARGEERVKILAKLAVMDEEATMIDKTKAKDKNRPSTWN